MVEAANERKKAPRRIRDDDGVVDAVLVCNVLLLLCGIGVVTIKTLRRICFTAAITGVVADEISLAKFLTNEIVGVEDADTERGISLIREVDGVVEAFFEVAMDLKIADTGVVSAAKTRVLTDARESDAEGVVANEIVRRSCFSIEIAGVVVALTKRKIAATRETVTVRVTVCATSFK